MKRAGATTDVSHRPRRRSAGARVVALSALLGAGCAVERWPIFTPDWDQRVSDREPVAVPSALRAAPGAPATAPAIPTTGPIALGVEQAVLTALARSRDLRVQQLAPVVARGFELAERGLFDPELFADASAGEQRANEVSRATGENFAVEAQDTTVTAGIRQPLPTGTTIELEAGNQRSVSNRTDDQHEARVGLTITQSLLQGFGPSVNLADVRQAELATLASVYELRGFTEALVAETETTYWLFALARREIEIFERSLEVAQQQRDETRQRIDVGVLPETEFAAAQAEVALREQALIDARSELATQRLRLLRLMNLDEAATGAERPLEPTSAIDAQPVALDDLADRLALAERLRPEVNEARLQLEQDRLETIITRNGLLPRLDFFITLGRSGYADSFRDATKDLGEGENYDVTAGATFSYFLGNRAAEGRHLAARATAEQAALALENLVEVVRLDVRLAAIEVERARQQVAATAATRAAREETVRAELERQRVGSTTNLLVSLAQRDLLESQIAEVEAIVGQRLALIQLYLAEGSLLERRGIRVAGRVAGRVGP